MEGIEPLPEAYPFEQTDFCGLAAYLEYLSRPYEEEDLGLCSEACYGFRDEDFICLDDEDRGIPIGLPPGLWNVLFPPAVVVTKQVNKGLMIFL